VPAAAGGDAETAFADLAGIAEYCQDSDSDDCDMEIVDTIIADTDQLTAVQASSALDLDANQEEGTAGSHAGQQAGLGKPATVGVQALRDATAAAAAARAAPTDGRPVDGRSFLSFSRAFCSVIDALGPGFRFVTKIVAGNVERLEEQASAAPHSFYTVPLEERARKTHLKSTSCAQAVVWLARSLRFAMDFLRNILVHGDETRVAVQTAHEETLAPYQSFVMRKAFTLATQVLPPRAKVVPIFGDVTEVEALFAEMKPLLDDLQQWSEAELA
jgi:hypothetical protein